MELQTKNGKHISSKFGFLSDQRVVLVVKQQVSVQPRTTNSTLKLSVETCLPNNSDCRTKDCHFHFLGKTCTWQRLETTSTTILSKNSTNSASIKMSADANNFHQTKEYRYFPRGVMAEWLSSWTSNRKGFSPRFEPCLHRPISISRNISRKSWKHEPIVVFAKMNERHFRTSCLERKFYSKNLKPFASKFQPTDTMEIQTNSKQISGNFWFPSC